eukprot:gene14304-15792_t
MEVDEVFSPKQPHSCQKEEQNRSTHRNLHKRTPKEWKEKFRRGCFQRLKQNRQKLVEKFRSSGSAEDNSITGQNNKEFLNELMNEELASNQVCACCIHENDVSEDGIEDILKIMDEIREELIKEEHTMLEEYNELVNFDESYLHAAIECLSSDYVICPVCKRNQLLQNKQVFFCACGVRIDTGYDGITLAHVKMRIEDAIQQHGLHCLDNAAFSVLIMDEIQLHNLILKCKLISTRGDGQRPITEISTSKQLEAKSFNSFNIKSTKDLLRTWLILKLSSFDVFVDNSEKLLKFSKKILGKRLFDSFLRATFYGQFGGGEDWDTLKKNVDILKKSGTRSILCIPFETSVNEHDIISCEDKWKFNADTMRHCIHATDEIEKGGFSQARITAMCRPGLLVEITKQLVDYETSPNKPEEWNFRRIAELLNSERYEDIEIPSLDASMNFEFREALKRMDSLAKVSKDKQIKWLLDAEQTYIQSAIGYFILLLQQKYNKGIPIIYGTYQGYRKDTLRKVEADYELAKENGFKLACKLVRGGYMIEEKRLAAERGVEDPICDGLEKTTEMYHSVADFFLPLIKERQAGVMFATHNLSTVTYLVKKMSEMKISKNDELACFAQLYGMCDHVTEGLAKSGFQVYKSVPYGSIDSTLLYLVRRAQENRSVMERGKEECKLITREVLQRMTTSPQLKATRT